MEQKELRWPHVPASRGPGGSRTSSRISTKLSVASNSPSRRQGPRPGRQLPSLPAAASCASLALVVFFFISLHAPPLSPRSGGAQGSRATHSDVVVHVESQPHSGTRTQGFWLPVQSSCLWPRLPGGSEVSPP